MKSLKFQQHDVIIYDVSADFKTLFCMWDSFVKIPHSFFVKIPLYGKIMG